MSAIERKQRREELCDLRQHDPLRVIEMYRRVVGLNGRCMLPGGMNLASLIESIIDHEADSGRRLDAAA